MKQQGSKLRMWMIYRECEREKYKTVDQFASVTLTFDMQN